MPPTLGQGGNQAIEDAVVLAHHADPERPDALGLAAYTAARRPRTTAIARKAVGVGRVNMLTNRPAMALRNILIAALDKTGPAVLLRGFDEIADWRPPQRPYAAQTQRA
jgi:2-polyprenyl-6-methoxyphenol hydroxylase-like FAD-dependent oxidoreductase